MSVPAPTLFGDAVEKSAVLSDDGVYRYVLRRIWDRALPPVLVVGLNPSTADAENDDPTIRRCIRFARDWGYGGLLMGNVFALRSTDPKRLLTCLEDRVNPVGELGPWIRGGRESVNDSWLEHMNEHAGLTLAAWGATKLPPGWTQRPAQVHSLLGRMHALGLTKDGMPRHPLYVKASARPIPLPDHAHDWGSWRGAEQSLEVRHCKTCGQEQWD
jgi:hypothetical protein